jgi:uridine kinase
MSVVERLAGLIDSLPGERVLVAFDGPDAAGKTTMADAVAEHTSRPVLRASVDAWHNPSEVRPARGSTSPEGYFLDSFDLEDLVRELLGPFRSGAPRVRVARFDHRTDSAVEVTEEVPTTAVLLFDGVFLLRNELVAEWDLRIYVHVPEEVTLSRAELRDRSLFGDHDAVRRRYEQRYLPGQALYRRTASPVQAADVVLDNSDWHDPVVVTWPRGA